MHLLSSLLSAPCREGACPTTHWVYCHAGRDQCHNSIPTNISSCSCESMLAVQQACLPDTNTRDHIAATHDMYAAPTAAALPSAAMMLNHSKQATLPPHADATSKPMNMATYRVVIMPLRVHCADTHAAGRPSTACCKSHMPECTYSNTVSVEPLSFTKVMQPIIKLS